jgi:hypothetical protein
MRSYTKAMFGIWFAAVIVAAAASPLFAQSKAQPAAPKERVIRTRTLKEVQGEVVSVTKRNISVLFARDTLTGDESEILIPYSPATVGLEHFRSLSQLAAGDIVRVLYEEDALQGMGKDNVELNAKSIIFVRKGQKKVPSAPVSESGTGQ